MGSVLQAFLTRLTVGLTFSPDLRRRCPSSTQLMDLLIQTRVVLQCGFSSSTSRHVAICPCLFDIFFRFLRGFSNSTSRHVVCCPCLCGLLFFFFRFLCMWSGACSLLIARSGTWPLII